MKPLKVIAGLIIAGGVAVGAMGTVGVGVAFADWPPPGPGHDRDHHDWGPPPPPPPPAQPPGTWNGGWEPDGGFCLFGACI
ncbi:hypothetical protein [Mycobacterium sp. 3519A]|uniref:hypothetical protein n=1 Tax=Mycobacterium sp. 3519A TaxID=2057184 RepID=UPI000C79CEF6|nr:hypothetical protein [Mycobacterium sp. 3519A]